MPATAEKTAYRLKADYLEACNCHHGCNCQFGGFPNEGKCEFVLAWKVKDGKFGEVSLNGVKTVIAARYPKAIHEGNGHVAVFIDEKASPEQVDAMVSILTGKMGGMPWEALAGTVGRLDGPVRKPIDFQINGERSHVRIPGSVEVELTPLKDPVSGEDKQVHIVFPKGGFLWNDGSVATTATMRVTEGDLKFDWPSRFAAASQIDWSNQK